MFRGFDDDPFFRDFNKSFQDRHASMLGGGGGGGDVFRDMDNMMNNMMQGFGRPNMGMLEEGEGRRRGGENSVARQQRSFFPDMGGLAQQMEQMSRDSGNGHYFSSQQVYSYRNTGDGPPEESQAISSTAGGPGGVKETKKGYKDSRSETQRMQYGRHIGDRAKVQERSIVRGNREEKTDYLGFAEEAAPEFDREWQDKAAGLYRPSVGQTTRHRAGIEEKPRNRKAKALPPPKKE